MIFASPHYLSRMKGYSQLLLCEARNCGITVGESFCPRLLCISTNPLEKKAILPLKSGIQLDYIAGKPNERQNEQTRPWPGNDFIILSEPIINSGELSIKQIRKGTHCGWKVSNFRRINPLKMELGKRPHWVLILICFTQFLHFCTAETADCKSKYLV